MKSARIAIFVLCALAFGVAAAGEEGHHWSYKGETGPAHWSALNADYAACGAGKRQSPIDIRSSGTSRADLPPLAFDYRPGPLRIADNGHTIQISYPPGSRLAAGGRSWQLVQFHFHRPSEDRIDGRPFDMVAHLVHRDAEGHLAVVAIPLRAGPENRLVGTLWRNLPAEGQEASPAGVTIDAADLLPAARSYYEYAGSLTTPPCTEGVTWFVLKAPATLSPAEIKAFARRYPSNARPVQPLNGRQVLAGR